MKLTTEDTEGTERATPETDAAERMAFAQEYMVPTEVARRLERERDEAREKLNTNFEEISNKLVVAIRERDQAREVANGLDKQAERLRDERDEARDDAAHWKIEHEIVVSRLCGNKHPRDNGVIFEHEIIPKLTRERDEARERAAKLAAQLLTEMEGGK